VPNIAAYAQLFPIYSNQGLYAVSATAQSEARGGNGEVTEENQRRLGSRATSTSP
jgi:hypothetical protein